MGLSAGADDRRCSLRLPLRAALAGRLLRSREGAHRADIDCQQKHQDRLDRPQHGRSVHAPLLAATGVRNILHILLYNWA